MASEKNYCAFVVEQLGELGQVDYRPMMGEYLLYYQGVLFGGIYDNRLLVKRTATNAKFNLPEVIPYPHAKPMYHVEDIDDRELLVAVVLETYEGLKQ